MRPWDLTNFIQRLRKELNLTILLNRTPYAGGDGNLRSGNRTGLWREDC